jgi:hypothetical protein
MATLVGNTQAVYWEVTDFVGSATKQRRSFLLHNLDIHAHRPVVVSHLRQAIIDADL